MIPVEILKNIVLICIGFSSGIVISGAIFAFIAIIGIVPRLAQKTDTVKKVRLYEEAIMWGGIYGGCTLIHDFHLPFPKIIVVFFSFAIGIFYGCLAVSLAEVLDVIPILTRRARVQEGVMYFLLSLALGKGIGALLYFFVPGFYRL